MLAAHVYFDHMNLEIKSKLNAIIHLHVLKYCHIFVKRAYKENLIIIFKTSSMLEDCTDSRQLLQETSFLLQESLGSLA
jgi:hypothetical protein